MKGKSSKKEDKVVTESYLESKHYITESYLESKHYVTEAYLDKALSGYVTKEYMESKDYITKSYLDSSLKELKEEMYRHTGSLAEHYQHMLSQSMELIIGQLKEISKKLDKNDYLLNNHEQRILTLELK